MYETVYLVHHGIKGQKWGVRHGPPYPIEDKVLKKGTKLNSVSGDIDTEEYLTPFSGPRVIYTYRKDEDWDNKVYKGAHAYEILNRGYNHVREHEFETVKDLLMPNKKERMQEFKDLLDDKRWSKSVREELKAIQKMYIEGNFGTKKNKEIMKNFDADNIKTDDDYKTAYFVFMRGMTQPHLYTSTTEYRNRMMSKYDAMVDDQDQGSFFGARDPIIIFKADQVLKDVSDPSSPHYLSIQEINDNLEELSKSK